MPKVNKKDMDSRAVESGIAESIEEVELAVSNYYNIYWEDL